MSHEVTQDSWGWWNLGKKCDHLGPGNLGWWIFWMEFPSTKPRYFTNAKIFSHPIFRSHVRNHQKTSKFVNFRTGTSTKNPFKVVQEVPFLKICFSDLKGLKLFHHHFRSYDWRNVLWFSNVLQQKLTPNKTPPRKFGGFSLIKCGGF